MADRYGNDVLSGDWRKPKNGRTVEVEIEKGMVVEEPSSGFVGAIVRWEHGVVDLEDRHGKIRTYPLGPGFWIDGKPVSLLFFLLIPDHVTQQHLEILSEIAEMFSDDAFRTALATDPDPQSVYSRIVNWLPTLQATG